MAKSTEKKPPSFSSAESDSDETMPGAKARTAKASRFGAKPSRKKARGGRR